MKCASTGEARPLPDEETAGMRRAAKRFHYCANAAGAAMLHALGGISCKVSEGIATAGTLEALKFFLSCASWDAGAPILPRASGMALRAGSGGAHLAFPRPRIERLVQIFPPCRSFCAEIVLKLSFTSHNIQRAV